MKYLCLIYDDEKKIAAMSRSESDAFMGEYFAFTERIRKSGHYLGGEPSIWCSTRGISRRPLTRHDLSGEAIRLGRLLLDLLPEPEVLGLVALMLLQESRRAARTSASGELVLLDEQDRSRWDQAQIAEGLVLVERALASRRFGPYTLQAAIAALHAAAPAAAATDWAQIVGLYDVLWRVEPSPVVELNRAAAVAMRDGPEAGLSLIDAMLARGAGA